MMYSIIKISSIYYYVTASENCLHEVATMYKDNPEKVSKYNDKLLIKLLNPYNFPLKQWHDYYFTITDDCIMMYFTPDQYIAPYYKNEITSISDETWHKMHIYNIPPLNEEPEEPIPVFKKYEEYVPPPPSDIEDDTEEMYYSSYSDNDSLDEFN